MFAFLSIIVLLNYIIKAQNIATVTDDILCASGSEHDLADGRYKYLRYNSEFKGTVYYDTNTTQYLYPLVGTNLYGYFIHTEPTYDWAHSFCLVNTEMNTSYIFNIDDCYANWQWATGDDTTPWKDDLNLRVINCNNICIANGNGPIWANGIYIWSHINITSNSSVYHCKQCGFGLGAYLYGWIHTTDSADWFWWILGPSYQHGIAWSFCILGTDLGPNYLFKLENCVGWATYNGSVFVLDPHLETNKCVLPETTTNKPLTTSIQTTTANITPSPTTINQCGTNRWCFDVIVSPNIQYDTEWTVIIQNEYKDDSNPRYFDIDFIIDDTASCINPRLTFIYERIDYDSLTEYIDVFDNNGIKIERCGDLSNSCNNFATCIYQKSLGVNQINAGNTYQISLVESINVDPLCTHSFSINANATLYCQSETTTSIPTSIETTPITTVLIGSKIECGTNEWCFYIAVTPNIQYDTSWNVLIQNEYVSGSRYFDIYFIISNIASCINPRLSFIYERIDYDSSSKYIDVYDNDGVLIERCGAGDSSILCNNFATCFYQRSLGINQINAGNTYQISLIESSGVDALCNNHSLSINANATLYCQGETTSIPISTDIPSTTRDTTISTPSDPNTTSSTTTDNESTPTARPITDDECSYIDFSGPIPTDVCYYKYKWNSVERSSMFECSNDGRIILNKYLNVDCSGTPEVSEDYSFKGYNYYCFIGKICDDTIKVIRDCMNNGEYSEILRVNNICLNKSKIVCAHNNIFMFKFDNEECDGFPIESEDWENIKDDTICHITSQCMARMDGGEGTTEIDNDREKGWKTSDTIIIIIVVIVVIILIFVIIFIVYYYKTKKTTDTGSNQKQKENKMVNDKANTNKISYAPVPTEAVNETEMTETETLAQNEKQ